MIKNDDHNPIQTVEVAAPETKAFQRFKSVKPVAINLQQASLVKTEYLYPGETMPLLVQPDDKEVDLADWAIDNRSLIESHLVKHGALLFRGFGPQTAEQFSRFAQCICVDLLRDNGEHQREVINEGVYTPVFYPPEKQLLWHNENSFNHRWPSRILFCCVKPPARGGETPIVDSRRVFATLNADIKERFIKTGVKYVRTYGAGAGLDWKIVFQTTSRSEVERQCQETFMDYEWLDGDRLRTSCVRPGVVRHPVTGETTWFNQAQHWHVSCLDQATHTALRSMFPEDEMPRNCFYGDGSRIEDSVMAEILKVYGELQVQFEWQNGDVLLLDNMLAAHGRTQFEGERKLLVAMGRMLDYASV